MAKLLFTPFSIVAGLLAGFLGKKLFEQIWGLIDKDEPPEAQAPRHLGAEDARRPGDRGRDLPRRQGRDRPLRPRARSSG